LAPSSISARSAAPERRFARASRYRPSSRNTVTPAATSRYSADDAPSRETVNSKPCRIPGIPASPKNSAHRDQPNAAAVPTDTSVSIVEEPCRRFVQAALWKGRPPQTTTGAASVSDSHCQLSNWRDGIIDRRITGTARVSDTSRRCRRPLSSGSVSLPSSSRASLSETGSTRAGSSAVYPVLTTVSIRSVTATPGG